MFRISILFIILCLPVLAQATEYKCDIKKKFDFGHAYSPDKIKHDKYSVLIEEKGDTAFVSRCSFSLSAKKITCDLHKADKVVFDKNVRIKKYYFFQSQFDVQLFSDLSQIRANADYKQQWWQPNPLWRGGV